MEKRKKPGKGNQKNWSMPKLFQCLTSCLVGLCRRTVCAKKVFSFYFILTFYIFLFSASFFCFLVQLDAVPRQAGNSSKSIYNLNPDLILYTSIYGCPVRVWLRVCLMKTRFLVLFLYRFLFFSSSFFLPCKLVTCSNALFLYDAVNVAVLVAAQFYLLLLQQSQQQLCAHYSTRGSSGYNLLFSLLELLLKDNICTKYKLAQKNEKKRRKIKN